MFLNFLLKNNLIFVMKKKLLLLLVCSMTAVCGFAQAISGTCGENLTWNFDTTGMLTINGTGAMTNSSVPWYDYRSQITQVEIENGVTSIVM